MKYKLGDEVYLKGVITSINSCAEIKYSYEVKTADEFVSAAEEHLEPINKSELGHAEEAPRYLRNILARLRELPEHDREVWLKGIMDEFELDFSHAKWREGYEQGKFDGAVEAEKSNKVVIPQFVADIIEYYKKKNAPIVDVFTEKNTDKKYAWWLATDFNAYDRVARAWLDGYDVEQEKRYVVTDGNHLYFKECQEDVEIVILADEMPGTMNYVKKFDSKDEAQKAADILGWKVQEVE
ncbi:DUF1642 domain-containing protein [Streptococcus anginosus]|uniref:DUF1642 domain-containing protein n=1 Tax=Streptococcus anginosus TaxID=1328 RepID=UPI0021F8883A|nr:DUF1642 domain-containing protein [Streptococcus anginosus]MCW1021087.1 DUF1642 domain-containing protein [Streptococcus anginosus]MCW1057148.1 DUF1642 domain-containing protein [Streptococcus anginosus]MED5823363.1 DUF1642 domain-containing protein [Streptococcus anginosus]MED5836567.1 DUF1642 domain-containing protein [Streptococcus anginosus]MED5847807.1 DUF1642 domain-containing protein [Streptococcus anginosus]